jgi:hypothetical protein
MEFADLNQPFTDEQKTQSFLYLQEFLLDKTTKNEPFFIGRLSGNEPNLCGKVLTGETIPLHLMKEMLLTAGIQMLSHDDVKQFVKMYITACNNSSILSIWSGGMYSQAKSYYDFLYKMYPDKNRICAQALEPYYFMNDENYKYDSIYKNKKVLVITSHKETTLQQLNNQRDVFDKPIFDSSTEFHVYKPTQQNCGNHDDQSWLKHLSTMQTELKELYDETHFDIALVSCGGFGMILSDYIYTELNKSVIYVGGSLQLYFGIMGNRWNQHPVISKLVNDKWTSVLDVDKPNTLSLYSSICENNCYW